MRLLIAEDDPSLLRALKHLFEAGKYTADAVSNGLDALAYAETGVYDGLVFDVLMPGLDGVSVLRRLRGQGVTTPALFLTARSEIRDRIEGLDAGADDYMVKPFSADELLARVRAMLRRKDTYTPDLLEADGLTLNRSTYALEYAGQTQVLSGREFQIMEMLMQRPHFIVTADEMMNHIWGWDSEVSTSVVWVHISNIRKKLAALRAPVSIRFVRGAGYTLGRAKA